MTTSRLTLLRLPVCLLGGALVLAAGLALARLWLPEWQGGPLPPESKLVERYRELAGRLRFRFEPGEPRAELSTDIDSGFPAADESLDRSSPEMRREAGRSVRVRVYQEGTLPGIRAVRTLTIDLSPSGRARLVLWAPSGWSRFPSFEGKPASVRELRYLARVLLEPGESLGELAPAMIAGNPGFVAEILGASTPEHLQILTQLGGRIYLNRQIGSRQEGLARLDHVRLSEYIWGMTLILLRGLVVAGLFLVLVSRRRIDVVNGAILGGVALASCLVPGLVRSSTLGEVTAAVLSAGLGALWVFVVWSAGESFLRAADPSFTTSLDALRAGRLGPRGGRSLLYGLALGATLAGLELAVRALAARLPGVWPKSTSVGLPVFSAGGSPFGGGIVLAGSLLVVIGLVRRIVPPKWTPAAAILAGTLLQGPLRIRPYPLELAGNLVIVALLILSGKRFGLTTLLTAAVTALLLPAAVFAGLHLDWLPATFAAAAGTSAGILALGLVGLRRPEQVELERLKPPPFIRRIEEERRIRYEMGLLARMQLGLLPTHLPQVEGWEIAAQSLLATEAGGDLYDFLRDDAGRLWIAAGDVAGHGYSCAIVHAMTTAALASLVTPERTPAEVLRLVDKVLRRGGHRNFTSLALLLLDLETGKALLSNAGHPYPFALSAGAVSEIEIPGLPLGRGPDRHYEDISIEVPPGGILVFCSDGLFEAVDWSETPYGFARPQEVLRTLEHHTAGEIVDLLLADWKRHLRSEEPPDDTTVVVVKRLLPARAEAPR